MTTADIIAHLATCSPEDRAELRGAFWDREIELDAASGALERTAQHLAGPRHLEAVWIERERKHRQVARDAMEQDEPSRYRHYDAMAAATKECRTDLQFEFRLVRRLGAGPMTDAEPEAYLDQELGFAKKYPHEPPPAK